MMSARRLWPVCVRATPYVPPGQGIAVRWSAFAFLHRFSFMPSKFLCQQIFKVAHYLCRGCHGPVPKGRFTWCSQACKEVNDPFWVRRAVQKRDKHVCALCGVNIKEAVARRRAVTLEYPPFLPGETSTQRYKRHCEALEKLRGPKIREEHDHVVPFSAGGKTVLENMRTVCSPCHKATDTYGSKVKVWARERGQRELLPG